jgi:hypothetical protein
MPRDVPDAVEQVSGPRKWTLTKKAREAIVSMKKIRPAPPSSVPLKPTPLKPTASTTSDDYLLSG